MLYRLSITVYIFLGLYITFYITNHEFPLFISITFFSIASPYVQLSSCTPSLRKKKSLKKEYLKAVF